MCSEAGLAPIVLFSVFKSLASQARFQQSAPALFEKWFQLSKVVEVGNADREVDWEVVKKIDERLAEGHGRQ
jgi:hypothetical protein